MQFTDIAIRQLKLSKEGQSTFFDSSLGGFGIRVGTKSKAWIVKYGKTRRIKTLGHYPDKSLSDARREAKRFLAVHSSKTSTTDYPDAVLSFLDEANTRNRPNTVREYKRFLNAFNSNKRVDEISRKELRSHLVDYSQSNYAHALTAFKVFFNWCIRNELLDKHPLAGERAPLPPARNRVLTPEEIKLVWHYKGTEPFCTLLKLCILTGQRRTELTYLDTKCFISDTTIVFPSEITKNNREHTIPITDMVKPLIKQKFTNANGNPFNAWSKSKKKLDQVVEIPHWTIHDLRRTFSTLHAELGTPIHITERLLNHSSGAVSGIVAVYNKYSYLPQMREAQEGYETVLKEIINGT